MIIAGARASKHSKTLYSIILILDHFYILYVHPNLSIYLVFYNSPRDQHSTPLILTHYSLSPIFLIARKMMSHHTVLASQSRELKKPRCILLIQFSQLGDFSYSLYQRICCFSYFGVFQSQISVLGLIPKTAYLNLVLF